jgi:Ca-activated chloride channel family protein
VIALGFAEPMWLLAMALAPLWHAFDRARSRRAPDVAESWIGPRRERLAPPRRDARREATARMAASAALLLLALAAARPQWGDPVERAGASGADLVLCLDVSRSMRARDVAPDRATKARAMVRRYCAESVGDRAALVLFAGSALLRVPLTNDLPTLAQISDVADELDVEKGGTDLGAALDAAALALVGVDGGAVVLLTDGDDPDARGLAAAQRLAARGISVHCVAIGGERGARVPVVEESREDYLRDQGGAFVETAPDRAALASLARAALGQCVIVDGAGVDALLTLRNSAIADGLQASRASRGELAPPERFSWFLAAAFALWIAHAALRRSADAVRA